MNLEYLLLFVLGGTFLVITKYITNEISAKIGAILATIPVGLFGAYFIVKEDKLPDYLKNYLLQTAFIVCATILYLYLLSNNILKHRSIFLVLIALWIAFVFSQLFN